MKPDETRSPATNRTPAVPHDAGLAVLVDRLVDGELDEGARRELLLRLEDEPGGWRTCALAFLEAQSWRVACGPLVRDETVLLPDGAEPLCGRRADGRVRPPGESPRSTDECGGRPHASSFRMRGRLARWACLAAALALAFVLGRTAPGPREAQQSASTSVERGAGSAADSTARPGDDSAGESEGPSGPSDEAAPSARPSPRDQRFEVVGIAHVDGDGGGQFSIPVVAGPGLDEKWLARRPAPLPDYVRQRLEREGYRVEQDRRLLSVELDDGSRLAIPLDSVRVEYVGHRVY